MRIINCKGYNIYINDWTSLNDFIDNGDFSTLFVLVDENTKSMCLPVFQDFINRDIVVLEIQSGEINKTLGTCESLWKDLVNHGADRHSLMVNLGGGVIGDLGGFVASTFMRGMHFIQVPTTLLSQVDASVGGKLGVDFDSYKNMIGVIRNPEAVFMFSSFLQSLPSDELRSGFAEVIKHGLIQDQNIFQECFSINLNAEIDWEEVIYNSVLIKKEITDNDPEERGLRKILNFGHTLGHAIESYNLNTANRLLHGEAIAIGMIMESHLSYQRGDLSKEEVDQIREYLIQVYGHHPSRIPSSQILVEYMQKDKKNKGSQIMFSLLSKIGEGNYNIQVSNLFIEKAIDYYIG